MNENKRFVNIGDEIHLNGGWWCSANGEHCADVITTALNELLDENEQLKIRFNKERDTAMRLGSKCDNLTIKNRKLELEIIRLERIIKTGEKMIEKNKRLIVDDDYNLVDTVTDEWLDDTQVFDLANELHEENLHLQEHLDMVREQRDMFQNRNNELQERNDRQYNELDKLYKLIEKREWEELYAIIEDFKKSEDQLQKEWGYLDD